MDYGFINGLLYLGFMVMRKLTVCKF
jgi:hypothetical protein